MSEKLNATCQGKSVSIECRRPSFESVRQAYKTINDEYKNGGAKAVFEKIGGELYREFLNNEKIVISQNEQIQRGIPIAHNNMRYSLNSCALRISYALNYSKLLGQYYLIKKQETAK